MRDRFARLVSVAFRGLLAVVLSLVGLAAFGLPAQAGPPPGAGEFGGDEASGGSQWITFGALEDKYLLEGPIAVSATASSGLPVAFATSTPGVCTSSGAIVTLVSPGTCTVVASQAGDSAYSPAPNVQRSFIVDPNNPPQPVSLTRTGTTLEWPAVRRVTQYFVMYRQVGSGKAWGVYATGAVANQRSVSLTNLGNKQRCSAANSTLGFTTCAMPYGWKPGVNYEFVVYGKNTLGRTTMVPLASQLTYVAP